MMTFIVAVLVACFVYSNSQETKCLFEDPTEKSIDGSTRAQTSDIIAKIDAALNEETAVNNSVNEIIAERVAPIENKYFALDTCPRTLVFVTSVYINDDVCYVVYPRKQRVTYSICRGSNCFGNTFYKSQCFTAGWTKLRFWVWCPKYGFRMIYRWYPQCCSCYRWRSCLTTV
ncbi:uncharacterized protein LOC133204966 [Saccostrea echinata]|uniref:uncharacterized protein LOC133204966 n=1 Tax=Saccostrea echinata TaxID=191078 RepID=UPI002A82CE12|nr:uncharacterized protein LOC133204966 [Saccostrea echinata]